MKRIFGVIALAISCVLTQAKVKDESVNVLYQSGNKHLKITDFETNDTATVISIRCTLFPGEEFNLSDKPLYLDDEQGKVYQQVTVEGLDSSMRAKCPFSGILDFKLFFEPLKKDVEIFDLKVVGQSHSWFGFWGIHKKHKKERKINPAKKRIIQRNEVYVGEGTTTIIGKIDGYVSNDEPQTLLLSICTAPNKFEHVCSAISEEGTFLLEVPVNRIRWEQIEGLGAPIPVMLVPSDTLYVDVKFRKDLDADISYRSAKGYDIMSNLMKADISYLPVELFEGIRNDKYRPTVWNESAKEEIKRAETLCRYLSWKYALSPRETRLLLVNMQISIAEVGIDYMTQAIRKALYNRGQAYSGSYIRTKMLSQEVIDSFSFLDFIDTSDYSYFVVYHSLFNNLRKIDHSFEQYQGEAIEAYIKQKLNEDWIKELGY